jgi:hypothetical protein
MLEPEHHVVRLHFASHREQIILMQWADEVDTQPSQQVARVTTTTGGKRSRSGSAHHNSLFRDRQACSEIDRPVHKWGK